MCICTQKEGGIVGSVIFSAVGRYCGIWVASFVQNQPVGSERPDLASNSWSLFHFNIFVT